MRRGFPIPIGAQMTSKLSVVVCGCLVLLCFASLSSGTEQAPLSPNTSGRVLILEYHIIASAESRWARSVENFRRDLDLLYREGFCPISVRDFVDRKIDIPAGRKPVILTFDDSSPGQMRYLADSGGVRIDPDCAVGMLMAFHQKHPDFPLKAIFFVLPGAEQPHKLFGQPQYEKMKLNELVRLGFEIGNHTLWHADLAKYPDAVVQQQLAMAQESVQRLVPGYRLQALSLPMGDWPKNPELALRGSYKGVEYSHRAVFLVAGGPARSPFDPACRFTRLPRIQVTGNELQYWLRYFREHPGQVYVSGKSPARIDSRLSTTKSQGRTGARER